MRNAFPPRSYRRLGKWNPWMPWPTLSSPLKTRLPLPQPLSLSGSGYLLGIVLANGPLWSRFPPTSPAPACNLSPPPPPPHPRPLYFSLPSSNQNKHLFSAGPLQGTEDTKRPSLEEAHILVAGRGADKPETAASHWGQGSHWVQYRICPPGTEESHQPCLWNRRLSTTPLWGT